MTIKHPHDILKLLDERIEAMEDLNVEELRECVKSFIFAAWYLDMLKNQSYLAKYGEPYNRNEVARMNFEITKKNAQRFIDTIEELTAAE